MAWEPKIMRKVRIRNSQKKGVLGKLLTAVAEAGGNVGSINLLTETSRHVVRDITITAEDEKSLAAVLAAMETNEGTKILEVRDEVLELHQKGKIAIRSRYPIESLTTLRRVYTPGVAEVCNRIAKDPSQARLYTSISHMVAIVTDGTAVLGLGDIGPLAGMPVMEGKAMLMETLVGLSGIPILLNTKDTDQIVNTVAAIAPTFAAIQLEDISAPRCFEIEERLQAMLDIPVLHDDQHGTAVVSTAALMTATREAGMDMKKAVIGQIGLGAAGQAIGQMMMRLTGNPVHGADLSPEALNRFEKLGGIKSNLKDIMANCDIVVATTGAPNLIKPEMVRKGQIILALSNPNAEIDPEVAMERGAAFAADGKSVNNVLGFPGIFRGAVDSNAPRITQEMLLAAAETIASMTPSGELVPNPLDKKVHHAVARAVAETAMKQGIARADYVPYVEE
ncbi:MAG TPA: malic enzyme-like NAD(P)-binding protein [Anaerolineales bacterium]|nr:malic enzyme-like NAD(P)-binding protein [Anaerolineales bacterium]HNE05465.1 malic enzyme-like NAD(P)-binding protein [Anaerolineales bacterium]HNF94372.1 malic enzyme-like NAD(P)-binding protein [Anaerolineales bacterium]HNM37228.1 malic enzyme-like NAD(P)-binding protein [Anaerolineales bacterium]HNO94512.1 malic enzyme-like NAD(P)-binding protein [Anaerolineales bacterium]